MLASALVATGSLLLGACDLPMAKAGARCGKNGAYAQDGTYVMKCERGRWKRGITVAVADAALAALLAPKGPPTTMPPKPPRLPLVPVTPPTFPTTTTIQPIVTFDVSLGPPFSQLEYATIDGDPVDFEIEVLATFGLEPAPCSVVDVAMTGGEVTLTRVDATTFRFDWNDVRFRLRPDGPPPRCLPRSITGRIFLYGEDGNLLHLVAFNHPIASATPV